jgi:tRNA 5-methylaminomethyl-2-thiouridine biosynthesis bifunctional protein
VPEPLVPARLAFDASGTPYSAAYDDVYHSVAGGLAQAQHVFLRGNGLPERWRGRHSFAILETGFGLGVNFLAAWQAWKEDPQRCERLHFTSIEKHPLQRQDLDPVLQDRWPILVPGLHRLEFEQGRVVLTLAFGDIADTLPQLDLAADAIFLDGFAPAKNPAMWEPRLLRHLGRLAAPGATVATWSVAASVREALEGAGFQVEKAQGFGFKREMLLGRVRRRTTAPQTAASRSAIVIGAGIAGAAAAERLASRGWRVTIIERHAGPAEEASGNHAGVFHPIVAPDDSLFARCTRASFLYLLQHWTKLTGLRWDRCGVLQLARDDDERRSQERAMAGLAYPPEYAAFDAARGGLWFPQAGWVEPRSLVAALLARFPMEKRFGVEVARLDFSNGFWKALDHGGKTLAEAPVAILANAADALRLAPQPAVRMRRVRGQLSLVPAIAGLQHVLLRGGMALPGVDGLSVVGASYDVDDPDTAPRLDSHIGNLERLEQMLPGASKNLDPAQLQGRVAFRAVVRDRLPLVGPLACGEAAGLYGAFGYGSRGLLWASLAGELLASMLEGEPLPLERKLAAAIHPERFLIRQGRRSNQGRSSLTSS